MTTATQSTETEHAGDRRRAARFRPTFGTLCRFRRCGESGEERVGLVWNISESGMSMLMADPPERGTELDAELMTESGEARLPIKLLVVHIREMPHGDYFMGAQVDRPLCVEELEQFLELPPVR